MSYEIFNGDCLEELKKVDDKSVQLILADLPYNTSACKWDCLIPMEELWKHFDRIIKDNGAVVLFAQQPFTSYVIRSNLKDYKYNWIWKKNHYANFLNVKFQPGKVTEDICVFGKMGCSYTPKGNMKYNPQFSEGKPYVSKGAGNRGLSSSIRSNIVKKPIDNDGKRYPTNILEFPLDSEKLHPTQKPVDLLRYLIRTYTDENDLVVDPTFGSGSCGAAALLEGRNFFGVEKDTNFFEIAKKRIEEIDKNLKTGYN